MSGSGHDAPDSVVSPSPQGDVAGGLLAAVRLLAVAFPVIVLADVLTGASRGLGSMRPTVWLGGVLQPAGQFGLVAAVALWWSHGAASASAGDPVPWLVAAWALPYLPVAAAAAVWLGRRVRREPYRRGAAGEFWRHTGPRSLGSAVQNVFQRLDIVIVAMLAGPAQAAVYTAATRFKVLGQLAGQGLAQAAQPALVRALADGDLARAQALYRRTTRWLVLITWPVWLGYAALAPVLLEVFGQGYAEGAGVAIVLAATMMFASACGMADVALVAAGRTTASLAGIAAATGVTVLLDLLLVPAHGAFGAALGWSAGVVVKNALPLAQIRRCYGLRPFGPRRRDVRRVRGVRGVRGVCGVRGTRGARQAGPGAATRSRR
ncbi:lipopolysaccharide biosynthesis protein [Thermopolyspora sp. NPDC052614]|uniref:lipopolysaccharide biosynthesis protein n=1 Tax=Thermopolyspora sp. NPDC052614 TaxID=3155682 RepID=UPI003421CC71